MNGEKPHTYKPRRVSRTREREFRFGEGRISGYLSVALGVLSFLAVLCFKYPSYLTTAELREVYDLDLLRLLLAAGIWLSLFFCTLTFLLKRNRIKALFGAAFTAMAILLGGSDVAVGTLVQQKLSFGLDWLILTLIGSAVLFIFFEKVFPKYRNQPVLRPEWQLDLIYFSVNHLLVAVFLLIGNYFVTSVFSWALIPDVQAFLQSLPLGVQLLILIICADFILYWSHRAFHKIPCLWPIHAIHHSVEHMDWLAGSRNHFIQAIVDRSLAMVPLYLLGPDKAALDIYVAFAALQAVFVHANIGIAFGPLKYIIATPQYHHWHHSTDRPAIDTNYAVHSPLFDRLFGTYHMPVEHWPQRYGTVKRLPRTFIAQLIYPFRR